MIRNQILETKKNRLSKLCVEKYDQNIIPRITGMKQAIVNKASGNKITKRCRRKSNITSSPFS